ncbi:MAG: 16S rRNA (uracil(1498)-N(3))-methyltransferase [Parvularculaceae bacterium]
MIPRLLIDAPLAVGANVALDEERAHYVRNVMRRSVGDRLLIFNARDGEFDAALARVDKKAVVARLEARTDRVEALADVELWLAPVKRAPLERIVEKATELGATRLRLATTERANAARARLDRLALIAREAAEQSGRLSAPEVIAPRPLFDVLDGLEPDRRLYFCDEAGDDPNAPWGGPEGRAPSILDVMAREETGVAKAAILIGPEGGFAPAERARLRAGPGVAPVGLGPRILRADTAAIAALTLWQAARGDWTARLGLAAPAAVSGADVESAPRTA